MQLGLDWAHVDLERFGAVSRWNSSMERLTETDVTGDDLVLTEELHGHI